MRKNQFTFLPFLVFLLLFQAQVESANGKDDIKFSLHKASTKIVKLYQKIEFDIIASGPWKCPTDYTEVSIGAELHSPSGRIILVDAFWFQDYKNDTEEEKGSPYFKIRFAPSEIGKYEGYLFCHYAGKKHVSDKLSFKSIASSNRGFIRQAKANPFAFEYDNGELFFPMGINKPYGSPLSFKQSLEKMSKSGGSLVRVWHPAKFTLVDSKTGNGPHKVDQVMAMQLDKVIELAKKNNVTLTIAMENQRNFRKILQGKPSAFWANNVFTKANGGTIGEDSDFWTDPVVVAHMRNRLRYVLARYAYSTSVFSWHTGNEMDFIKAKSMKIFTKWHERFFADAAKHDIYDHLVHQSMAWFNGYDEINRLPGSDLNCGNIYHTKDCAQVADFIKTHWANKYGKPVLIGEYGVSKQKNKEDLGIQCDPKALIAHNLTWGMLANGIGASGMSFWTRYIEKYNQYTLFAPVRDFLRAVPLNKHLWKAVQVNSFLYANDSEKESYGETFLNTYRGHLVLSGNGALPPYQVTKNGTVDAAVYGQVGGGGYNVMAPKWPELYGPKEFCIDMASDGFCHLYIAACSDKVRINAECDGEMVLDKTLTPKNKKLLKLGHVNEKVSFPLSAGKHKITLSSKGPKSNFYEYAISFENHRKLTGPDLQVRGIQCEEGILLWLKRPKFNYFCEMYGEELSSVAEGNLILDGIAEGNYQGTWIDSFSGDKKMKVNTKTNNASLSISVPRTNSAIAIYLAKKANP
ncbi:MAG: DUF5060 domain-containing protein [Planctomycetes bacterium]|nr:DUF5060 domain-containing protein [Planctomycetota bacterium]